MIRRPLLALLPLLALTALGCDDDTAAPDDAGRPPIDDGGIDAMAPDGMAPDSMAPDGTSPDGMAPDGMAPDSMVPDGMAPDGMAPDGMAPDGGPVETCEPAVAADPAAGLVHTAQGAIEGEAAGDAYRYRAVPFAAPPTGNLRWRAPAPPACYAGVHAADAYPPACPQVEDGAVVGDEECLYLNIWTPAAALTDGDPRPVMVFIHGGGNAQGSSTVGVGPQLLYEGQTLAEQFGVTVVVIQYRLGTLAWLAHPALADAEGRSGNYGTRDQIAALEWVRDNIAAFGGDPDRVTLFGESAGGRNICVLLASPPAGGLFHGAIIQSGGCVQPEEADVRALSDEIITANGCDGADDIAECMRALTPTELIEARPPVVDVAGASDPLQPYPDGYILAGQPDQVMAAGEHNRVPVIVGANADETSQSAPMVATAQAYEALMRAQLGPLADRALELYPVDDYDSPRDAYVQVSGDAKFVCGARRAAAAAERGGSAAFYYHFDQNLTNAPQQARFGAFHGIELFFVWQRMRLAGYRPSPEELALSEAMGHYWTSFAATGVPSAPDDVEWPTYDAEGDRAMLFEGGDIRVVDGLRAEKCDFWDTLRPL